MWHSVSPWAPTGYGQQTALFTPRLAALDNTELAISSYWGLQGSMLDWNGIRVYPGEDWGNRSLAGWVQAFGAGERVQVITLMDVWPLNPHMIRQIGNVACWTPVDHKPVPYAVAEFLRDSGCRPIAMSKFGQQELQDLGVDAMYVPHGVDTSIFKPAEDRAVYRERFGMTDSRFVVGMVANNQGTAPPRKAFAQALIAFSEFHRNHPDSMLYLHAEVTGYRHGVDLNRMLEQFGVPDSAVRVTNQLQMEEGIAQKVMAALYSTFDVLLNPSYGEGFGVPILEAQACGTPVIVTDWTSMTELCGAGWKVGGEPWYDNQQYAFWRCPAVGEIVDSLEAAYSEAAGLREQAVAFAAGYDADLIVENYWRPTLDKLAGPREVPPLALNRAHRRAAKKKGVAA